MLKEVHVELGQSQFGRHVNHKLRVTEYVKGRQSTVGFKLSDVLVYPKQSLTQINLSISGQDRWRQNQMNTLEGENKQTSKQGIPKAGNKRKNTDQKKSKKKKVEN